MYMYIHRYIDICLCAYVYIKLKAGEWKEWIGYLDSGSRVVVGEELFRSAAVRIHTNVVVRVPSRNGWSPCCCLRVRICICVCARVRWACACVCVWARVRVRLYVRMSACVCGCVGGGWVWAVMCHATCVCARCCAWVFWYIDTQIKKERMRKFAWERDSAKERGACFYANFNVLSDSEKSVKHTIECSCLCMGWPLSPCMLLPQRRALQTFLDTMNSRWVLALEYQGWGPCN